MSNSYEMLQFTFYLPKLMIISTFTLQKQIYPSNLSIWFYIFGNIKHRFIDICQNYCHFWFRNLG